MLEFNLTSIAVLHPTRAQQEALDRPGPFRLRRAWPRSEHNIGLEYADARGQLIPAQWFSDPRRLCAAADQTRLVNGLASARSITIPDNGLLLQVGGADRRLTALVRLLAEPTAQLLSHRPERRAVFSLRNAGGLSYAKIVRRKRVRPLVAASHTLTTVASKTNAFVVPRLQRVVESQGLTIWSALSGTSYFQMLQDTEQDAFLESVAAQIGRALLALHRAGLPPDVVPHGPAEEIEVLNRWLGHLKCHLPEQYARCQPYARPIFQALEAKASQPALLHRDFYDKQIVVDRAGTVGLLDLDTLAVGEPALDLANALAHLELRQIQGRVSAARSDRAAAALLRGYQPHAATRDRLPAYLDAARLRLACVYSFRPGQQAVAHRLTSRLTHQT